MQNRSTSAQAKLLWGCTKNMYHPISSSKSFSGNP